MSKKSAELVFIVDRSGSMTSIAQDMEGAIKSVLKDQKKLEQDIYATLVRFDDEYEKVFTHKPIADVKDISIEPRSMTALLDAIGKTVNSFEREYSEMEEKDRPDKVLFIIITDGGENASQEFTRDKVFGIIETVKRDHNWEFTFIGANQDAIGEGGNLGIERGKSINFVASAQGVRSMSESLSSFTSDFLDCGEANFEDDGDSE